MDRRVYAHKRKYTDVVELEKMMGYVLESLSQEYLAKMYRSITREIVQVIDRNGQKNKYFLIKNK